MCLPRRAYSLFICLAIGCAGITNQEDGNGAMSGGASQVGGAYVTGGTAAGGATVEADGTTGGTSTSPVISSGGVTATGGTFAAGANPATGGVLNWSNDLQTGGQGYRHVDCSTVGNDICGWGKTSVTIRAPLPADTSLIAAMTFEICLNGSCGTFAPATVSGFYVSVGGSWGATIPGAGSTGRRDAYFRVEQVPCASNCATPQYQLRTDVRIDPNSGLSNGDVWTLTARNGDGSTFYAVTAVANYELVPTAGTGDFEGCSADCKRLTVPITT